MKASDAAVFGFFAGIYYAAGLSAVGPVVVWALDVSPLWAAVGPLAACGVARATLYRFRHHFRRSGALLEKV